MGLGHAPNVDILRKGKMDKKVFVDFFTKCSNGIKRHSPEILTGFGISGMLMAIAFAIKSTTKAVKIVSDKKRNENERELTAKEVVAATWKCYIPSALSFIVSSGCIIGASAINSKRNTALAAAYSLSESALKLYQEKVIETIGEKKEREIKDKVDQEKILRNPVSSNEVIITDGGCTLCYDSVSDRYFKSNIETLKQKVNELNRMMTINTSVSLNDFYDEIGLKGVKTGDHLGWNINKSLIELTFSSQLADNGTPCLVIDFRTPPEYDFE